MTIDDLLTDLHKQNTFQIGQYTLKSGYLSPIYIDLRILISSPTILKTVASKIKCKIIDAHLDYDYILGVPYGAIPIATLISKSLKKPMLLKRKEAKSYGQKKLIEGVFEKGKKVLIIEDVVTSGASILETTKALEEAGLICEEIFCVLNREQGGLEKLQSQKKKLHSIITMTNILEFLVKHSFITEEKKISIQYELKNPKLANQKCNTNGSIKNDFEVQLKEVAPYGVHYTSVDGANIHSKWALKFRLQMFHKDSTNYRLIDIMLKKQTNLCIAADYQTTNEILNLIEITKRYICAIKLHYDIIKDFNKDFIKKLIELSEDAENGFIIIEDRKFADTGKTMELQLSHGNLPIIDWSDLVTVHSIAGSASLQALSSTISSKNTRLKSCLLVAELSTEGALTNLPNYREKTVEIAKNNSNIVSGFICQTRFHDDPSFIYWTPGVNADSKMSDGAGQQWRTIYQAIYKDKCDIIIVGRGICNSQNVEEEAQRYAKAGWIALMQRDN